MDLFPAALTFKRLIYLIFVVAIACTVQKYFLAYAEQYWIIWTAVIFSLLSTGATFFQRIKILCLLGVAVAATVWLVGCVAGIFPLLAILLLVITCACVSLSQHYPSYVFAAFCINLFAILASSTLLTWPENSMRSLFILFGMAIAIVPQIIFWPRFIRDEIQADTILALRHLKNLSSEIFSCFLHLEYKENLYLFEKRLHIQKNKCMRAMRRLQAITKGRDDVPSKLARLYDIMLDCAQLRRRVSDYSTFGICQDEFAAMTKVLDEAFSHLIHRFLGKSSVWNQAALTNSIKNIEDNYHSVLEVTAREPLMFLLFITSLKAWAEEMNLLYITGKGLAC